MLDVSIRAEILELMREIQKENNISMIYITHDLATAKHFADNILILNSGKVMEVGTIEKVLHHIIGTKDCLTLENRSPAPTVRSPIGNEAPPRKTRL